MTEMESEHKTFERKRRTLHELNWRNNKFSDVIPAQRRANKLNTWWDTTEPICM